MARRMHLVAGLVGFGIFVATGAYMRTQYEMATIDFGERMLLRSRHIYILFGSLIHLALGIYLSKAVGSWRGKLQWAGSLILVAALAALIVAFAHDAVGGRVAEPWARPGIFGMLGGIACHLVANLRRSAPALSAVTPELQGATINRDR